MEVPFVDWGLKTCGVESALRLCLIQITEVISSLGGTSSKKEVACLLDYLSSCGLESALRILSLFDLTGRFMPDRVLL